MSDDLVINAKVTVPAGELSFSASRSSGPGGQHVNTTDSRIQLRWNLRESVALTEVQRNRLLKFFASRLTEAGELILACDTNRSQRRNREEVVQRLAALVREALIPPKPRRKTRPTAASRERRLQDKRRRSNLKKGRGSGNEPE
ncbi:MAG: aminoacyl-tRNA hydrolase [Gemmatimonadales bacterium]|nr:aminoacyl-tRNA hydrolase [Gemmatimonadales bacterium]